MKLDFEKDRVHFGEIYSSFENITEVGKISAEIGAVSCKFTYYEDDEYVFIYDDVNSYNGLIKQIAGNREEVRKKLVKYKNNFGVEHALWKQLIIQAGRRFSLDSFFYADHYPEDNCVSLDSDYFNGTFDSLLPIKEDDIQNVYEVLMSVLPQNIEKTKTEYIQSTIKEKLNEIENICGKKFEYEDEYFSFLSKEYGGNIQGWNEFKNNFLSLSEMVEASTLAEKDLFIAFSRHCINYVDNMVAEIIQNKLLKSYGPVSDIKKSLRDSINKLAFMELLDLYKEYKEKEKLLNSKARVDGIDVNNGPYKEYVDVFRLGSVLISDKMNVINKNKAKNKYIPQELKDEAMIFYYDTQSAEDAYDELAIEKYSQNKESGAVGEQKVEYALKWLDKSYISIRKESVDKAGNKCILISNPEFIDEIQEYDHIVLSANGIFCIETKNYTGKLVIDENGNWIRRRGDEEEGIRNPIQQIRQHEKVLTSFLPIECKVRSIICIANDKAIIEGSDNCSIPIVKSDMLVEYIESITNEDQLSEVQVQECEKAIYDHMKR